MRYRFTFPCPVSGKIDSFMSINNRLYNGDSLDGKHFRVTAVHVRRVGHELRVRFLYGAAPAKHSRWVRAAPGAPATRGGYQRMFRGVCLAPSANARDAHRLVDARDLDARGVHDIREGDAVLDETGSAWVPLDTKRAEHAITARKARGCTDPRRFVRFLYQHTSPELCSVFVHSAPAHVCGGNQ